jgi:hypothetical protein
MHTAYGLGCCFSAAGGKIYLLAQHGQEAPYCCCALSAAQAFAGLS